jgi:hypothetical protein
VAGRDRGTIWHHVAPNLNDRIGLARGEAGSAGLSDAVDLLRILPAGEQMPLLSVLESQGSHEGRTKVALQAERLELHPCNCRDHRSYWLD